MIIGYNEDYGSDAQRTGSHNLVLGVEHSWTSYAGLVAGYENSLSGDYAVAFGLYNSSVQSILCAW